jgi:tetratricopeptide (TPR) repeat protein
VQRRSPVRTLGARLALFLFSLSPLSAAAAMPPQDPPATALQPHEQAALAARADGRALAAATALLQQAETTAATRPAAADAAATAARVEAWFTQAARMAVANADRDWLQRFDRLAATPLLQDSALLRDRLAVAALPVAERVPGVELPGRARAVGLVRDFWLLGPFANERGAGFSTALPPEQGLDLDRAETGKRREVRWRRLPTLGHRLELPLHTLVTPHEQSLAYVATALLAERDTEAVLELGSTGSVRVWLNGAEVFARDVERPFALDQDAVAIRLSAGANLLLVKVCHQEGDQFTFAVRLRGRDGAPLPVVASSAREDLQRAAGTAPAPAPSAAAVPLGGRSHWQVDTATGADALRLCWLLRARQADADGERRDEQAARAACRELPELPEAWLQLAGTLERHGRSAADRDDNERRRALERVIELAPRHTDALAGLGNLLLRRSGLWRPARELADRALAVQPDHGDALLLRALTLREQDRAPQADAELVLAAARTGASVDTLHHAAEAMAVRTPAAALALREQLGQRVRYPDDCRPRATLLARTGRADDAIELLLAALVADPLASNVRLQLADLYLTRGDAAAAIELLTTWQQLAPDDTRALVLLATAHRHEAQTRPPAAELQLATLREALAVEPNRREEERYAEFLASTGGASADANAFYAADRIDAEALVRADQGPPADAKDANDALHWLLQQTVVRANGNGTTNVYHHRIVRVLSQDGARSLQNYQLPYYSGEQRARLLGCTVWKASGTVQRPALQGARVRLPDLQIGDVVAIEGRVDDLAPSFFGDYFGYVHGFAAADGSPLRRNELVVLAEPGRDYRVQAIHGAPEPNRSTLADGTLRWQWRMDELPRDVPEVRRPDAKEYEPLVRITTYRDWQHFATWWWNLIQKQLEVTPAMRATVARLCEGRDSTEAKIAAIYHFVTTDVRYEAWEFGVHGYKPYSTAIIHERRHGDCKDKALLLCALLGEIGVPCHPVLIFADPLRSEDDLELPMVQHFNHCIAWLPPHEGRPGRFLDGTATWHPTDTLPDMDQGARVLVVDRGRAELLQVPWTTPDANHERTDTTISLQADGTGQLRLEQAPRGNLAIELRSMLATEPLRRNEVIERQLVQTFGKAKLEQLVGEAPRDPEQPVQLAVTAALPEVGQRDGDRWQLPSVWGRDDLLGLASDSERRRALLLGVPNGDRRTLRYRLPPGWRPSELPPPIEQTAPFGSFVMRWRSDGDSIVVERNLELAVSRVGPTEFAAFREFLTAVKAADGQRVLLQQEARR